MCDCKMKVPFLELPETVSLPGDAFASVPEHLISCLNWPDSFPYAPDVRFRIFHNGRTLFLEYDVTEKYTAALADKDGQEVYMDSCVEFFLRVDGEKSYYNFEWNAAGTMYMTYRPGRESSEPAPEQVMSSVKRLSTIGPAPVAEYGSETGENRWRLQIAIPVEALWHSGLKSFSGLKASANFFKCGDGLHIPHYLTWAPVGTKSPDYHRPEFFAPIEFAATR